MQTTNDVFILSTWCAHAVWEPLLY